MKKLLLLALVLLNANNVFAAPTTVLKIINKISTESLQLMQEGDGYFYTFTNSAGIESVVTKKFTTALLDESLRHPAKYLTEGDYMPVTNSLVNWIEKTPHGGIQCPYENGCYDATINAKAAYALVPFTVLADAPIGIARLISYRNLSKKIAKAIQESGNSNSVELSERSFKMYMQVVGGLN